MFNSRFPGCPVLLRHNRIAIVDGPSCGLVSSVIGELSILVFARHVVTFLGIFSAVCVFYAMLGMSACLLDAIEFLLKKSDPSACHLIIPACR